MNKKIYLTIILLLGLSVVFSLKAQERVIHGMVTTFDSIPLIDAEVQVKSTKQVVRTDEQGSFSVGCENEDQLKISANGFYSEKVKLEENIRFAAINLRLKPGEKNRTHALGYGHVADADKLNAVASLSDGDNIDFTRYKDMYELIRGRFAGVQIVNDQIIIRGRSSTGTNAAQLVIDGVTRDNRILWTLTPSEIQSINIIKDGSAAVYGLRGANGVVVVETKR